MKELTKLPEYWVVDFRENREKCIEHVIPYLRKRYGYKWAGTSYRYYGYDGNKFYEGTNCYNSITTFENNPVEIPIDDFIRLTTVFVLPEKWCIKVTEENESFLKETDGVLFPKGYNYTIGGYYSHLLGRIVIPGDYTEISLEQFKKYVLKEKTGMEKTTVRVEFVKEAHQEACEEWKAKIEAEFPEIFSKFYSIGQRFIRAGEEYILSRDKELNIIMVNLKSGDIYTSLPIKVKSIHKITEEEFSCYLNAGFKLKE